MQAPAANSKTTSPPSRIKLSEKAYARRQKVLLEGVLNFFKDEFKRSLDQMLNELEQQLFKSAEQARSNEVQRSVWETQRLIRDNRAALVPDFLAGIESELASFIDQPVKQEAIKEPLNFTELSLVETGAMDESVQLREIATRCELRNSLPLFLLGQRFGVIAGRPAYDSENLPVGPQRICAVIRDAVKVFGLDGEQRAMFYRQFDRYVMHYMAPFYDTINNYLISQGVLPGMSYVVPRGKPSPRRTTAPVTTPETPQATLDPDNASFTSSGELTVPQAALHGGFPSRAGMASRAVSSTVNRITPQAKFPSPQAWQLQPQTNDAGTSIGGLQNAGLMGQGVSAHNAKQEDVGKDYFQSRSSFGSCGSPSKDGAGATSAFYGSDSESHDPELFNNLRSLLAGRRGLLEKLRGSTSTQPVPASPVYQAKPAQLQISLGRLQQKLNQSENPSHQPTFSELKRGLQEQLRADMGTEYSVALSGEQSDTVDLVGMLFEQIGREVGPTTPGASLLAQLQLPLLRVALNDTGFFSDPDNPARRMLNTIAETSAYWSGEEEVDRDLIQRMSMAVKRVNEDDEADPQLFGQLVEDLNDHLSTQQRKAEVSERRHVEAARGREKLEIARLKAEEVVQSLLENKPLPKFLGSLLEQVWTDVLALSLLRGDETSPMFKQRFELGQKIVAASVQDTTRVAISEDALPEVKKDIEAALAQVGHSEEEASEVSAKLLSVAREGGANESEGDAEPASRTELAIKLRNRARLGQDVETKSSVAKGKGELASLTPEEKACHEKLKSLPFGSWFEFTINQQGDRARRRMSWYSNVTDHCLFVNHRGQRAGEYSLAWVAREMAKGNIFAIEAQRASIVDRAWKAIVSALKSFSGGPTVEKTVVAGG